MFRRVRPQPACGLLELTLAARSVVALGVEPGDGDVHETLEEVALVGRGDAPLVLELLVSVEVPSLANQLETSVEAHGAGLSASATGASVARVATILLVGVDLFFRGKLDVLLGGSHRLTTTESIDPPDLVIADVARVDPDEVAETYPDVPILGFTNHTDTAGLRAAQAAGLDRIVVRSALAERASQLVDELVA
jgi:hypothetical protein